MPKLASNRVAKQIQAQVARNVYNDEGVLLIENVSGLDEYGQPTTTTISIAVPCSFTDAPDLERWKEFADIEQISAEVRFASATAPSHGNRFVIQKRFGNADYPDMEFEIVGIRDRGEFGYVCALRKVRI